MRIAFIAAGSGSRFYCENCAGEGSLVRALRSRGHEIALASFYLPVGDAEGNVAAHAPLFYGAIGMYLSHRLPVLRSAPARLLRALDAPALLALAGRFSGPTQPGRLEALTLSMLRGEEGRPSTNLGELLRWLESIRPDVVHLSNGLLLGVAGAIRRALGIPVSCTLQDEDTWIESLGGRARAVAWKILRERAADVALFTPVSRYFGRLMADHLGLSDERYVVVHPGIDLDSFPEAASSDGPPVIGYLSRISEPMGAGLLADAFILLAREGRFPGTRLRLMGGSTSADAQLVRSLRQRFVHAGLAESLEIKAGFGPRARALFLGGISALCVPVLRGEAFGTFMLEAMAAEVPVVQPRLGGFPEVVQDTGGGILYEPNTTEALASALGRLLADPEGSRTLGRAGRRAVAERYTVGRMAAGLEAAFERARCPAAARGA